MIQLSLKLSRTTNERIATTKILTDIKHQLSYHTNVLLIEMIIFGIILKRKKKQKNAKKKKKNKTQKKKKKKKKKKTRKNLHPRFLL